MAVEIFSSKIQPYGLLSNNAVIPITVNGKEWLSVTEYVYVNLFDTEEYREKMRKLYNRDPFDAAIKLKNEEDERIYLEALIYGTRARFSQNKDLMEKLIDTRDRPLKVIYGNENESRRLSILFNQLRYDENFFIDDKYGRVTFERVNAVMVGVAKELSKNPDMESKPFPELERFASPNAAPRRDLVALLNNLDEIVPVLKIKFKDVIYVEKIKQFKEYLLDETLNYILETKYPHLSRDTYDLAKYQQKQKQLNDIPRYEEKLYDLYLNKGLPLEVSNKLEWTVSIPTENEIERTNEVGEESATTTRKDIIIKDNHEFLPSYPDSVKIGGKSYRSVISYAYSILFEKLGDSTVNVNALDLFELVSKYKFAKMEKIERILTENNAIATEIKFQSHPSLVTLLLATENLNLIWADRTDRVLGLGPPMSPNRAGTYLEFLRSKSTEPEIIVEYPLNSVVISAWFKSRVEDYANTLTLFENKNTKDLRIIYRINKYPIEIVTLTDQIKTIMNNGGLNDSDQKIVLPLLASELENIFRTLKLKDIIRSITRSYNLSTPSEDAYKLAEENLKEIYKLVRSNLRPDIDRKAFIDVILSNQPLIELKQEQWWRINYWSSFKSTENRRSGL